MELKHIIIEGKIIDCDSVERLDIGGHKYKGLVIEDRKGERLKFNELFVTPTLGVNFDLEVGMNCKLFVCRYWFKKRKFLSGVLYAIDFKGSKFFYPDEAFYCVKTLTRNGKHPIAGRLSGGMIPAYILFGIPFWMIISALVLGIFSGFPIRGGFGNLFIFSLIPNAFFLLRPHLLSGKNAKLDDMKSNLAKNGFHTDVTQSDELPAAY